MRITRALGLSGLLLLLSSCNQWMPRMWAQVPLMFPETHVKRYFKFTPPEVRLARLQHFNNWRVQGVFSVECIDTPHAKPVTVTYFSWKNIDKRQFNVRLESAQSDYDATIMVAYEDVIVWRDFKYPFHIKNPEGYMLQEMGWCIPMRSLAFWLRGIPAPAPFHAVYNKFGLIEVMEQQGWTIRYKTYTDVDGYSLPRTITLLGPHVFIRVSINNWDTLMLNRSVPPL